VDADVVVVGGGVLGTMHAVAGLARGLRVVQLEREAAPRGASVRNFGLVWVSGRAAGAELALGLRARERWETLAAAHPGTGFRANTSLTVARGPEETAVLEAVAAAPDAAARGVRLLAPGEARRVNPALEGSFTAALWCERDAVVEPRQVLAALRAGCEATGRYQWLPGREVVDVGDHEVRDATGESHRADRVLLCTGAWHGGLLGPSLAGAPLRRVRLQMLQTAPLAGPVPTSVADGDSLRYYPAFDVPARRALPPQAPDAASWAAQLLLVQRVDGSLTIGDTHEYEEPFAFDLQSSAERHLLGVAGSLLGAPLPAVERRWSGVYSQLTEAAGDHLYLRHDVAAGVQVVTGPGGRGMTLAPAIAEESFT